MTRSERIGGSARIAAKPAVERARKSLKRGYAHAMVRRLTRRNRSSRASILGSAPVVVSLTSYGRRVQSVALTIESIGAGRLRPARVILWLGDAEAPLPDSLTRLQARGLEILYAPDIGPHGKYFHYVSTHAPHERPLVTADDDVLYPRYWLARLVQAHRQRPDEVHCFRANKILVDGTRLSPYNDWPRCRSDRASLDHFATGVAGVIYPPAMLDHLARLGDAFKASCPRADDVWLHWVALRNRVGVRQLSARPRAFPALPDTQTQTLTSYNVHAGGNDEQIRALYTEEDVAALEAAGAVTAG